MNYEDSDPGQNNTKTKAVKSYESIFWPENAVMITVEEVAVLLQDSLM